MPNIIGGKYKKTTLDVPSKLVRPTSAFKREAIFSIIESYAIKHSIEIYKNKSIIDIFAGSGSVGLEAISRGIEKSYFIENNDEVIKILEKNCQKICKKNEFEIITGNAINSLDEKFIISEKAWRLSTAGYSSMFVMVGDEVSVEDLLKGIIVASGNDACVALAEGIAGTEEEFSIMMTSKAKEIGMTNTNFANSSGLNDPDNYSTVRDIMIMSNYLIKNHPDYYKWFS